LATASPARSLCGTLNAINFYRIAALRQQTMLLVAFSDAASREGAKGEFVTF
jgi:hypothetical protein